MTYDEFVAQFISRVSARLNGMKTALVSAGITASRVTVEEVDSNDLRYKITATRGSRTLICYIELTDNLHLGGTIPGQAIITVWLEGNGVQITGAYSAGVPQPYTEEAGIDVLMGKLTQVEIAFPELVAKARTFLGV